MAFHYKNTYNTSWSAPYNHMPPPNLSKLPCPNLPTSGTKFEHVITQGIALLIMGDGGHSLTFAKVATPNIIKVAVNHHVLLTHKIKVTI